MHRCLLLLALLVCSAAQAQHDPTWVVTDRNITYNPNPSTIEVKSVSFSNENGGQSSGCGNYVQSQCNGKTACSYTGTEANCETNIPSGQKYYLFVSYVCAGVSFSKQVEAGVVAKISCPGIGNVGIGTTTPQAKLEVNGEVKFGNTSKPCNYTNEGQQRYNFKLHEMEYCDGTKWLAYLTRNADIAFGNSTAECNSSNSGLQRFNTSAREMEYCDGSAWLSYLVNGSPVNKLRLPDGCYINGYSSTPFTDGVRLPTLYCPK